MSSKHIIHLSSQSTKTGYSDPCLPPSSLTDPPSSSWCPMPLQGPFHGTVLTRSRKCIILGPSIVYAKEKQAGEETRSPS
jgi:hypothetical protein